MIGSATGDTGGPGCRVDDGQDAAHSTEAAAERATSDPTGSDPTGSDPTGSDPARSDPAGSECSTSDGSNSEWARFIRANTRLSMPPLVPEIRLHLADQSVPIWLKTEAQLGAANVPPPYWAFAWAGGQAVARHILDQPSLVANHRVLDLGAGSGLTAIAARQAGASAVLAADIDIVAGEAIRLNAAENATAVDFTARDLLSGSPAQAPGWPYQIVIVGDLFYERELARLVLAFIEAAAALGSVILIGDPQRNYFPHGRFARIGQYEVPVTRELEDSEVKSTAVWRLG